MQVEEVTPLIRHQILPLFLSPYVKMLFLYQVQTSLTAINKALEFALVDIMCLGSNIYLHNLKESVRTFSGNSFYF